jgi:predicted nucleic acid-binding protein
MGYLVDTYIWIDIERGRSALLMKRQGQSMAD